MEEKYVLAVGELLIDAISNVQVDDLSQANYLNIHPGGSTANFCRYLRRCGTDSRIVSTVGQDGFGNILLEKVQHEGLSIAHITQIKNHFTSLIVVGRTAATPDFIPYRDADKYITWIEPLLIENASWIHSTAFSLSAAPARTTILSAFKRAGELGLPVSVDWNYSEKIWLSLHEAEDVFTMLQELNPYLKFSLDDVQRFSGKSAMSIEEAISFLQNVKATFICLTCGSDGVYYREADQQWQFLAAEKIEVKNATGAGDSFWAGFIHAKLAGFDTDNCVRFAMDIASKKLQGQLQIASGKL